MIKKKILLFPILPALLIELLVLKRSLDNYFSSQIFSPSKQIALETESQMILGAKTDVFTGIMIERILIGVIIFLVVLIGILFFKTSRRFN